MEHINYLILKTAQVTNNEIETGDIPDCLVRLAKKKPSGVATKTNPSLWSRCKSEAKSRMGGKHSARAMQLAVKLYKQRGGGYKGKKPTAKTNKMKKWTKQKWMYLSDYKKKDKNKLDDEMLDINDPQNIDLNFNNDLLLNNDLLYNNDILHADDPVEISDLDELLKMFDNDDTDYDNNDSSPGRYLPEAKWRSLSEAERKATDAKKKREGKNKQYVPNTEKAKVKSKSKYY